jgi:hypothetical protein
MAAVPQQCRLFSPSCETLARDWRARIESEDEWAATSAPGPATGGESAGYLVSCGPVNAYCKPSMTDASPVPVPRAAHEKIASDLAQDLELPVPPAVLLRWGTPPHGNQSLVVCTLIPFHPAYKWDVARAVPGLEATLKFDARFAASAMIPFDTWLGNTDRLNGGNLIVNQATAAAGGKLQFAYLDFAYSMSKEWRPDFRIVTPVGVYPTEPAHIDVMTMEWVISAIENMPDETIRLVVTRVPEVFLPRPAAQLIIDGLIYRKSRIRDALKPIMLGARP